jgi:hypothetical protein
MDKVEALAILEKQLEHYRGLRYGELLRLLDESQYLEVTSRSGTCYQVEICAFWDDKTCVHLRVVGTIDDGGWRAFVPLSSDFIVAPDGSFVGE